MRSAARAAVPVLLVSLATAGCVTPASDTGRIGPATAATSTSTTVAGADAGSTPIELATTGDRSTFDGFPVRSYIPEDPSGVVFVFHGTGGSSDLVDKIEVADTLNLLTAHGYGWVATDSTDRSQQAQWNVASGPGNDDLDRLDRLWTHLVETTPASETTPRFGIGMSNGSVFVSRWADASRSGDTPVAAVVQMEGPAAVELVKVPTIFVLGANDTTVRGAKVRRDRQAADAAGTPTELIELTPQPLTMERLQRVPAVSDEEAHAVIDGLRSAGVIDERGEALFAGDALEAALDAVVLPSSVGARTARSVTDEVRATFAMHEFNSEPKDQIVAFFDAHR